MANNQDMVRPSLQDGTPRGRNNRGTGAELYYSMSPYIFTTHTVFISCAKRTNNADINHTHQDHRVEYCHLFCFFSQSNTANGKKKMTKGLWGKSQRSNTNFNMLISHHKKESKETRKKTPCLQFFLDCKNDSPLLWKPELLKTAARLSF